MTPERKNRLVNVLKKRQTNITVVLENVFDPHNISAVLRSCDAIGIQDVYVLTTRIAPHQRWGYRSSSGAYKWVTVHQYTGVVVRHLSLSSSSSRPVVASGVARDTVPPPPLRGSASVSGVVRGVGGLPVADAQVRVLGAAGVAASDFRGRFTLGDLPAGTQVLEVRRIGYLLAQQPVELRSQRSVTQDVRLQRIVTLDSVRVLARRSRYREFEEHRKRSGFGTFLTEEDIERRRPFQSSDLFRMIPGFRVIGLGLDAQVLSSRGVSSVTGPCRVNIVIDGMPYQDINLIHPGSIGALEVYRPGQPAPVQYDSRCGVIVVWSKR